MANRDKFDVTSACKKLTLNGISISDKKIQLKHTGTGIKMWAAIDYLVNHCKYTIIRGTQS